MIPENSCSNPFHPDYNADNYTPNVPKNGYDESLGYGYGDTLWFDDMTSNPSDSNESLLSFVQDDDDSNDYGDIGD